jgi:hypothetical protein
MRWEGTLHLWGIGVGYTEESHFEDLDVDGSMIWKHLFKTWNGARTGLFWVRIGAGCNLLQIV